VIHPVPHQYCFVDSTFTHRVPTGFVPAVWFLLHTVPGRMFGATLLLESGAMYRDVPLHALAHEANPAPDWCPSNAQRWDAYSDHVQVLRVPYLDGLRCSARVGDASSRPLEGRYLFSVQPLHDDYSREPSQDKTMTVLALDNGRYTCQPTDRVLVHDPSWTTHSGAWHTGLKRADARFSSEVLR
jgi:hypothetical protein